MSANKILLSVSHVRVHTSFFNGFIYQQAPDLQFSKTGKYCFLQRTSILEVNECMPHTLGRFLLESMHFNKSHALLIFEASNHHWSMPWSSNGHDLTCFLHSFLKHLIIYKLQLTCKWPRTWPLKSAPALIYSPKIKQKNPMKSSLFIHRAFSSG